MLTLAGLAAKVRQENKANSPMELTSAPCATAVHRPHQRFPAGERFL